MMQGSFYRHDEVYTSVIATPNLVGRQAELAAIHAALHAPDPTLVYITGPGGIGKTVLLRRALDDARFEPGLRPAHQIIDLYHTANRTPEGLAQAIQESIAPDGDGFADYLYERRRLEEFLVRTPARMEEVYQQRRKMFAALINDLQRLSGADRLVLAFDTAEYLFFETDPVQEQLSLKLEQPAVLGWLIEQLLPELGDVVVLLAGRPGPERFAHRLTAAVAGRLKHIQLGGLDIDATRAYFDAVASTAEASGAPESQEVAEALRRLGPDQRETIFWTLYDQPEHGETPRVRPILLALAITYVVVAGRPLDAFRQPPERARLLDETGRRALEADLSRELASRIRENRLPADEALLALAYARKGADAELIARIADFRTADGELDTDRAREIMNALASLAFVKVRHADDRLFLHDEMYDLLQRFVLDSPDNVVRAGRIFFAIREYYQERIEAAYAGIRRLYQDLPEGTLPDPTRVIKARVRLQDALVEDLHYRLRYDPLAGFSHYFRYANEALLVNDEILDMQLRTELFSVLSQEQSYAQRIDEREYLAELDALVQQMVIPDAAIRWVQRFTLTLETDKALDLLQRLRTDQAGLIAHGGPLWQAELAAWESLAYTYKGDVQTAADLLSDERLMQLENLELPEAYHELWQAILARSYNNRGYLERVKGNPIDAATPYRKALLLWRSLRMQVAQADTLNNLAYVMSFRGAFDTARRYAIDALNLRQSLGQFLPVVLSLNTLAEIEIYAGRYQEAETYARRAMTVARPLAFLRGEGLARLSLATLMRYSADPDHIEKPAARLKQLQDSLEHAREAFRIFSAGIPEGERAMRALIEEGSTLREICRQGLDIELQPTHAALADEKLRLAEQMAVDLRIWNGYLDAALGRAWLFHYIQKEDHLAATLGEIEAFIQTHLEDYRISTSHFPGSGEDYVLGVFNQMARMHILLGVRGLQAYERAGRPAGTYGAQLLAQAADEFTLTFEYNHFISDDFREIRRATNLVYNRLKSYSNQELLTVYEAVHSAPGRLIPASRSVDGLLFWQVLAESFGPYEALVQFAR